MPVSPFGPIDSDVSPALLPLAAQQAVTVSTSVTTSASGWSTGDYKISAQAADHDDVGGGKWLICDATSIDSTYAALIALVGSNRPDARGRTLVMKGTHADVSTFGANDGVAVANRRPKHRHTAHTHTVSADYYSSGGFTSGGIVLTTFNAPAGGTGTNPTSSVDGGSGNVNDSLDAPAFLVPGSLFIHT